MISWIVPNALKYEMEPIIIELNQVDNQRLMIPHPGEEFGYVLEGQVTCFKQKKICHSQR
jgi:hypothetical protein